MPVSAVRALKQAASTGEPLPLPEAMRPVERAGGKFRRGHLVMIAAIPNAGKSALAQWIAATLDEPTLYFSADQDRWTTTTRLAATLSGDTLEQVENLFDSGAYDGHLSTSKVEFCFDSNPSVDDIMLELDAWVETWDTYPTLIVVDNLLNIEGGGDREGEMWIIEQLHSLARLTKACVILLAHGSESQGDPGWPIPRKQLLNKLAQLPDMILTVALDSQSSIFRIAVVKSREGKADPKAERPLALNSDFSRQQFMPIDTQAWGGWSA